MSDYPGEERFGLGDWNRPAPISDEIVEKAWDAMMAAQPDEAGAPVLLAAGLRAALEVVLPDIERPLRERMEQIDLWWQESAARAKKAEAELAAAERNEMSEEPFWVTMNYHVPKRGYSLSVHTDHVEMQVYVSEKGRNIQAYEPTVKSKKLQELEGEG